MMPSFVASIRDGYVVERASLRDVIYAAGVTDSQFKTAEAIARGRLASCCTPIEMTVAHLKLKSTGCEEELCLLSACSEIPI